MIAFLLDDEPSLFSLKTKKEKGEFFLTILMLYWENIFFLEITKIAKSWVGGKVVILGLMWMLWIWSYWKKISKLMKFYSWISSEGWDSKSHTPNSNYSYSISVTNAPFVIVWIPWMKNIAVKSFQSDEFIIREGPWSCMHIGASCDSAIYLLFNIGQVREFHTFGFSV